MADYAATHMTPEPMRWLQPAPLVPDQPRFSRRSRLDGARDQRAQDGLGASTVPHHAGVGEGCRTRRDDAGGDGGRALVRRGDTRRRATRTIDTTMNAATVADALQHC